MPNELVPDRAELERRWYQHERGLAAAMESMGDRLTHEDRDSVAHYISVREYGLAFDSLIWAIYERELELTDAERGRLDDLALHLNAEGHWEAARQRSFGG